MLADILPLTPEAEFTNWIFWILSVQLTIWLSVLKFWLLYYDMRWSIAAHRKQWHRIINPKSIITTPLTLLPLSKSSKSPTSDRDRDHEPEFKELQQMGIGHRRLPSNLPAVSNSRSAVSTPIPPNTSTSGQVEPAVFTAPNMSKPSRHSKLPSLSSVPVMEAVGSGSVGSRSAGIGGIGGGIGGGGGSSQTDWGPVSTETRSHQRLLFWLRHKRTFGNYRFMFGICVVVIFIFSIGQSIPAYLISFDGENGGTMYLMQGIISVVSYVIAGIILSILLYHINYSLRFDDNFYIELELKYLFILLTSYFIIVAINATVNMTGATDTTPYDAEDNHLVMIYYVYTVIKHACFYGIWLLHSKWVLYKLKRVLNDNTLIAREYNRNTSLSGMLKNLASSSRSSRASRSSRVSRSSRASATHTRSYLSDRENQANTMREIEEGDKIIEPIISHHVQISQEVKEKNQLKVKLKLKRQKSQDTKKKKDIDSFNIGLNDIISHKKGIDLFMVHLARELSTECLLSIIEFIQFQNYLFQQTKIMLNDGDNNGDNDGDNDYDELMNVMDEMEMELLQTKCEIRLPHTIPNSDAFDEELFDNDNDNDDGTIAKYDETRLILNGKKIAYKIYQKYVKIGADYEINVHSRTRRKLMQEMDDFQDWILNDQVDLLVLFHLFEQCFAEMVALLNGCLTRFTSSAAFKKFKMTYF